MKYQFTPPPEKLKAFTLAEVLITLVIIGVVAAITIPTIIANSFKEEVLSKTKKAYSTLSRCVMLSKMDNGYIEEWYDLADKNATNYYNMFFKQYLQGTVSCKDYKKCGYSSATPWKYLNGKVDNWQINEGSLSRFFFYLADGTFVAVRTGYASCSKYDDNGNCINYEMLNETGPSIIIDINGGKAPNMFGKDVFFMNLNNEKGVVPQGYGLDASSINSNCSKKGQGNYCLQKLISDGWSFDKGYPI